MKCVEWGGESIVTVTSYIHTNTKQYWPVCCIGLIGAYSNYTDKSAIPSHWHLVVTRQQLLLRCEVLCAHGLSGQCSVLRQVACKQVMEVEGKEEREGKRREYGVESFGIQV